MKDFGAMEKYLRSSGNAGTIMEAVSGEDTRRLESMIDKDALSNALAQGDVKSLESMLRQVLNTGEGKALAQKISGLMNK